MMSPSFLPGAQVTMVVWAAALAVWLHERCKKSNGAQGCRANRWRAVNCCAHGCARCGFVFNPDIVRVAGFSPPGYASIAHAEARGADMGVLKLLGMEAVFGESLTVLIERGCTRPFIDCASDVLTKYEIDKHAASLVMERTAFVCKSCKGSTRKGTQATRLDMAQAAANGYSLEAPSYTDDPRWGPAARALSAAVAAPAAGPQGERGRLWGIALAEVERCSSAAPVAAVPLTRFATRLPSAGAMPPIPVLPPRPPVESLLPLAPLRERPSGEEALKLAQEQLAPMTQQLERIIEVTTLQVTSIPELLGATSAAAQAGTDALLGVLVAMLRATKRVDRCFRHGAAKAPPLPDSYRLQPDALAALLGWIVGFMRALVLAGHMAPTAITRDMQVRAFPAQPARGGGGGGAPFRALTETRAQSSDAPSPAPPPRSHRLHPPMPSRARTCCRWASRWRWRRCAACARRCALRRCSRTARPTRRPGMAATPTSAGATAVRRCRHTRAACSRRGRRRTRWSAGAAVAHCFAPSRRASRGAAKRCGARHPAAPHAHRGLTRRARRAWQATTHRESRSPLASFVFLYTGMPPEQLIECVRACVRLAGCVAHPRRRQRADTHSPAAPQVFARQRRLLQGRRQHALPAVPGADVCAGRRGALRDAHLGGLRALRLQEPHVGQDGAAGHARRRAVGLLSGPAHA
jgi:hypothetical protein